MGVNIDKNSTNICVMSASVCGISDGRGVIGYKLHTENPLRTE